MTKRFRRRFSLPYALVALISVIALLCIVHTFPPAEDRREVYIAIPKFTLDQAKNSDEKRDVKEALPALGTEEQEKKQVPVVPQGYGGVLPSIVDSLPQLSGRNEFPLPSISFPNETIRSGVKIVIGIPTVSRKEVSYLSRTLQSLLFSTNDKQREKILIVVMVADESAKSAETQQQITALGIEFNEYFNSGLLHVIVPPAVWYPQDLHQIEPTLGDPPERMYWRTKQNLDYLYLMLYCRSLGEYYLQIEDDVLTKKGFVTLVEDKIEAKKSQPWFTIDFSSLGFIGKLFRSKDLQYLTHFIALLHRYKPVDWILDTVFYNRYCIPFESPKNCTKAFKRFRIRGPTLFQHVGTKSSLEGKVQKLREKNFAETMSFNPHLDNPAANATSSISHYRDYSFQGAYDGISPFWSSQAPAMGDFMQIQFSKPAPVKGILIRSGNAEHPEDIFDEKTSVSYRHSTSGKPEPPTFFNEHGIARINFDEVVTLNSVRIDVTGNYTHWVLISELSVHL